MRSFVLAGLLFGAVALAPSASPQSLNQAPSNQDSAPAKPTPSKTAGSSGPAKAKTAKSEHVKAESVTINMPEGVTRDQADAILNELREIHKLLEKPQPTAAAAQPAAPPPPDKVSMKMENGFYSMGSSTAPVTMVEFSDYQCPFCRHFNSEAFVQLKKNYIDTGKMRFISRDLPLEFHDNANRAAEAARCAGDQGKYWEMRNVLITNATALGADQVSGYAQGLSLEMKAFNGCLSSGSHKADIQKDQTDANSMQISGTPTFIVGKMENDTLNGVRVVGAQPYTAFDTVIRQMLGNSTP